MSTQAKVVELPIKGGDNEHEMYRQLNDLGRRRSFTSSRDHVVDTGIAFNLELWLEEQSGGYKRVGVPCHLYGAVAVIDGLIVGDERLGEVWTLHGCTYINFQTWALHYPQLRGGLSGFQARYNVRTRKGTFFLTVFA